MVRPLNPISSRTNESPSSFIVKKNIRTGDIEIEKITGNILARFAQILKKLLFESTGFSFYIRDKSVTKITIGFIRDAISPDHINRTTMNKTAKTISILKDQKIPRKLTSEIDSFDLIKSKFDEFEKKASEFIRIKYNRNSSKEYQERFTDLYFALSQHDYAKPIRDKILVQVLKNLNPKDDLKVLYSLIQDHSFIDYQDKLKILKHVSENLNPDRYENFVTALAFFNADRLEPDDRIRFIKPFLPQEMENLQKNGTKIDENVKKLTQNRGKLTEEIEQLKEEIKVLQLTLPKKEELKILNKFSLPSHAIEYKNIIAALRQAVINGHQAEEIFIPKAFVDGIKEGITRFEENLKNLTKEREERARKLELKHEGSHQPDFYGMELVENERMLKEFVKKYDLPETPTKEELINKLRSLPINSPTRILLKAEARAILDLSNAVKEKRMQKSLKSLHELLDAVEQLKDYQVKMQVLENKMAELRRNTALQQKTSDKKLIFENALTNMGDRLNKLIELSKKENPVLADYQRALNPI